LGLVKLRVMDDRFQADLWCQALEQRGIAHLLRTYEDTAYDGIYVTQKGYGVIYVEEEHLEAARGVDQDLAQSLACPDPAQLARSIDHTLLDAAAGEAELETHLEQCLEMEAAAACVSPWMVPRAVRALAGSPVAVCTVVGFPLGTQTSAAKLAEAGEAAGAGAVELDVVFNRGWALGGELERAVAEMADLARELPGRVIKVILETSALGPEASRRAARALVDTGVEYLKTGTGFFGPATVEEVSLLARAVEGRLDIKAAGGIRSLADALALQAAGAQRLGTSSGYDIYRQARERWEQAES